MVRRSRKPPNTAVQVNLQKPVSPSVSNTSCWLPRQLQNVVDKWNCTASPWISHSVSRAFVFLFQARKGISFFQGNIKISDSQGCFKNVSKMISYRLHWEVPGNLVSRWKCKLLQLGCILPHPLWSDVSFFALVKQKNSLIAVVSNFNTVDSDSSFYSTPSGWLEQK